MSHKQKEKHIEGNQKGTAQNIENPIQFALVATTSVLQVICQALVF